MPAQEIKDSRQILRRRTAGAEALVDSGGLMPGMNPRPALKASLSAAGDFGV